MWLSNYNWHFDYVRLAKDTGFSFEKTKSPLDKNKVCMIDLDKIIIDRDVGIIEQFLPTVILYNIETCEHLGILDPNFLKLFRISQLAVDYLLFCKKYLDHTVTLLKEDMKNLKLENHELKIFNEELKQHTDILLEKCKKNDVGSSFKCSKCSKMFSSEEYLASHMQRRHASKDSPTFGIDIEMEIKEIKQKLNNTEKLIKNEELNPRLEDTLNRNNSKVSELLLKFESLKNQVESDFKILHTQKEFEDKYSKIFQNALDNMKNQVNNEFGVNNSYKFPERRNSLTQTEFHEVETCEKKVQVDERLGQISHTTKTLAPKQKTPNIEEQMSKAYENLTITMGTSMKNIEVQMQALWEKLQQLEAKKTTIEVAPDPKSPSKERVEITASKQHSKPSVIKRFTIKSNSDLKNQTAPDPPLVDDGKMYEKLNEESQDFQKLSSKTRFDDLDRIDVVDEPEEAVPSKTLTTVRSVNSMYETDETLSEEEEEESTPSKSSSTSECSIAEHTENVDSSKSIVLKQGKSLSTLGKRSITSLRKASLTSEVTDKLKKEMERVLGQRLEDLGLSQEWKGIPEQTYLRTMEILNHQVSLVQKSIPDYKTIRKNILKGVDEEVKNRELTSKPRIRKTVKKKNSRKSLSLRTMSSQNGNVRLKQPESSSQIEIKNRKMFETDSSTDENPPPQVKRIPSDLIKKTAPYSAVIEELKKNQKSEENLPRAVKTEKDLMVESVSEKKETAEDDMEKNEIQTKGVLKNILTVGPVPKKRVLFDLKNDNIGVQKTFVKDVGGGSTTSVASSVLDLSEDDSFLQSKGDTKSVNAKDVEDLSDSDFSLFDSTEKK